MIFRIGKVKLAFRKTLRICKAEREISKLINKTMPMGEWTCCVDG